MGALLTCPPGAVCCLNQGIAAGAVVRARRACPQLGDVLVVPFRTAGMRLAGS